MKRSLSTVLWGVLFTSVIAGALTLSMVKLWQTRFAKPAVGTPPQGVVSAGLAASPEIVGTENPVPVNPTPELTPTPKHKASNTLTTPSPQISNLTENDSQLQPQPSREFVRAKSGAGTRESRTHEGSRGGSLSTTSNLRSRIQKGASRIPARADSIRRSDR